MTAPVPMMFDRRVVEVLREGTYGSDPGGVAPFPAFSQDDLPLWGTSRFDKSPSSRAFGASRTRLTDPFGQFAPLRTYLLEGDDSWLMLLEASGFKRVSDVQWAAQQSASHTSLTIRHHQDRMRQILTGVRGSVQLRASAGGPIAVDANLSGRMREEAGTPPRSASPAVALKQFCNAQLRFDVDGVGEVVPKGLTEVAIDSGTVLVAKAMSGGRLVWRVQNVVPELRVVVDQGPEWWWVSQPDRVLAASLVLGGYRWEFPKLGPTDRPAPLRQASSLAGVSLVFRSIADRARPVTVTRV